MKPPICEVCDEAFDPADGALVSFVSTEAGRHFAQRRPRAVGHPPDDGWFCAGHRVAAESLASTHTLSDAVAAIQSAAGGSNDAAGAWRRSVSSVEAARAELERRTATRIEHDLRQRIERRVVIDGFRETAEALLEPLGLDGVEPTVESERSTSKSPEWRESITATELTTTTRWETPAHRVDVTDCDTVWDSWSGRQRTGDLMQGIVRLRVDDTWMYGSFGADGFVETLVESGERTPAACGLLDALIGDLRSGR